MNESENIMRTNTKNLTLLSAFYAILIIIQFSPIAQISLGIYTITIMHTIVLIGIFIFGFKESLSLGLAFGLLSMFNAIMFQTQASIVFVNPLVSVLPRVLFALFAFSTYQLIKRKNNMIYYGVWAGLSTFVHTTLVLFSIYFFSSENINLKVIYTVVTTNGLIEVIMAAFIVPTIGFTLRKFVKNRR